jgi:hypothetical protein
MNEIQKQTFKKLMAWALSQLNTVSANKGCSDLDVKDLKLTEPEKEIMLAFVNSNSLDFDPVEEINSDFHVTMALKNMVEVI